MGKSNDIDLPVGRRVRIRIEVYDVPRQIYKGFKGQSVIFTVANLPEQRAFFRHLLKFAKTKSWKDDVRAVDQ
jgi:hypothetical protein